MKAIFFDLENGDANRAEKRFVTRLRDVEFDRACTRMVVPIDPVGTVMRERSRA